MCMTYKKDGVDSYVRACYRTGQRGRRVPIADAVWSENGHLLLNASTAGQPTEVPDGQMLHFRTGLPNPVGEADMARYAYARALHVTELDGKRYISLHVDRASPNVQRRAQSFGWRQVSWGEGLPVCPTKMAKARTPRRKIETWHLIVMFDHKPDDTALRGLYDVLSDEEARRWWKHTVKDTWQLNAWRDVGWTRGELAACWRAIRVLGGREYRSGDDPDVKTWEDVQTSGDRAVCC